MANPAHPSSPYWWSDSDAESEASRDGGVKLPDAHQADQAADAVEVSVATDEEKERRIQSILDFFNLMYDTSEDLLSPLRILCLQLRGQYGKSGRECQKILNKVHINVFDFVEEQLGGADAIRFNRAKALHEYSEKHHKVFPVSRAEGNPILQAFLHVKDPAPAADAQSAALEQSQSAGPESSATQQGGTAGRQSATQEQMPLRLKDPKGN